MLRLMLLLMLLLMILACMGSPASVMRSSSVEQPAQDLAGGS
jgi:hypothetical protein